MQYIGMRPAQQITALCELSDQPFQNKTLYNLNALFNQQQNKGLATTNVLIKDLKAQNIHYEVKPDKDRFTEHLFIALPKSIKLALQNQDIVLVDNTYKTNKFEMPLLYIVGKLQYSYFQKSFKQFSSITARKLVSAPENLLMYLKTIYLFFIYP